MKILVIGGTRYFGIHMVNALLTKGHEVTLATRGKAPDTFDSRVKRIIFDRLEPESIKALGRSHYNVVIDNIAYCSNDIRNVMEVLQCDRYIFMSSASVYREKTWDTREEAYDGAAEELIWCGRGDFPYGEVKRQAENALFRQYADRSWTAVRYPVVLGRDDYTKRLLFYVEHIARAIPMCIDDLDSQMSFIRSDEAGQFLAFLADNECQGAINGSCRGTVSLREMVAFIEEKTGVKAIITSDGEAAPYNGEPSHSINTERAEGLGFSFSNVRDWIFDLLEYYINNTAALR